LLPQVPLLLTAIACFEGPRRVVPILQEAWADDKWKLCLPGLAYAAQNVLYFMALSHISAASYQLLSQTKLLFTGVFMASLLGKRLGKAQYAALALLMGGSVLTQLSEVCGGGVGGSSLVL
jgi:UDP-sugar transporter A1/2/3